MSEKIELKGIEYPINFGWNAIRLFSNETKVNINHIEVAIANNMYYTFLAIYIGIKEGHRKEKKDFDLTIDDFVDLFDAEPNQVAQAIKLLLKSLNMVVSKIDNDPDGSESDEKDESKKV